MSAVLAFDIGGTNLRAALIDGREKLTERRAPSAGLSPEALATKAAQLAAAVEDEAGVKATRAGAGVAAMLPLPGDVIENAPNLGWRNAPLKRLLSDALGGRPVSLFNDVDAICAGEARYGAGAGAEDVACIFLGTGLGSGFLTSGRLLRGFRGVAAELGHVKVEPDGGRACGCGEIGCLEAYVGGASLLRRLEEALADRESATARVAELARGDAPTLAHVDAAAGEGDPWADGLWSEVAGRIALAVANAATVLNPEVIVFGGGVFAHAPGLLTRTREQIPRLVSVVARQGLRLVDAELGDDAGLFGAAALTE